MAALTERLAQMEALSSRPQPVGGQRGPEVPLIDTRTLGRPDTFEGTQDKWADRAVVAKAYATLTSAAVGIVLLSAENAGEDRRAGAPPAPAPRAVLSRRLARLANPPPSYAWYLDAAISTVSPASRRRDALEGATFHMRSSPLHGARASTLGYGRSHTPW